MKEGEPICPYFKPTTAPTATPTIPPTPGTPISVIQNQVRDCMYSNTSSEQTGERPKTIRNFNEIVWVKITPAGEQILEEYYKRLNVKVPELERDAEGFTEMQLWKVANIFGKEMRNGQDNPSIEMTFKTRR